MSIKLEAGKTYVSRNGRVFGPLHQIDDNSWPFLFMDERFVWKSNGWFSNIKIHQLDLVSEYVEPILSGPIAMAEQPTEPETPTESDSIQSERQARYGDWSGNAELTDKFLYVAQSGASWSRMSASQRTAIGMALHKIGRMLNGDPNYEDNWVDAISYLDLALKEIRKARVGD